MDRNLTNFERDTVKKILEFETELDAEDIKLFLTSLKVKDHKDNQEAGTYINFSKNAISLEDCFLGNKVLATINQKYEADFLLAVHNSQINFLEIHVWDDNGEIILPTVVSYTIIENQ
ncbi:MAG: hypothetical protein ACKE9I_06035 [Methylophagaceae bacterium]